MIDFMKENYEWLFSGIGVTFLAWLIHWLKKVTKRIKIPHNIIRKLQANRNDLPPVYFTIVNKDGTEEKVEAILAFEFKDSNKEYVVYTKAETDQFKNVTVYVSYVDRSTGSPKLVDVPNEDEWRRIREVLKDLAESKEKHPFFDEYGIEIL